MKNIFHKILLTLLWLAGAVFFFFLSIYMALSFLTKGLRRLLKWKELYHFREQEFPVLNVTYDSEKNIPVGKLPAAQGETLSYHIPLPAKEVLLEFKLNASPGDVCAELDYCLSSNDATIKKEFIYIFINPFDAVAMNFDTARVWYPVPEDKILKVHFADIKTTSDFVQNYMDGHLNIVQYR